MSRQELAGNNNQVPPGYKQTEVGVIPEDWEVVRVGDLEPYVTSGSRGWAKYYSKYGASFIRITNLNKNSIYLNLNELKFVALPNHVNEGKRTRLKNGDILISITADIGIIGYINSSVPQPAYINQHISLVRFDLKNIVSKYIAYFLVCEKVQRFFRGSTDQGAKAGINLDKIRSLQLAIPPLPEQKAIASVLSDVDELISSLDKLIAKKRHIKTATMQQLLTGKTRLPGFGGEWETKSLEYLTECLDNLRIPLNEVQRARMKGNYPYCGANGILDYVNEYIIDDDIILLAEDGGYFDEHTTRPIAYRMKGKCWVNNHVHILKAKPGYHQDFLFYCLVHKNVLPFLASGTRAKLNKSEMNKIEINLPKNSEEQKAIASVLSDMDKEIAALEKRRAKTQAIKQGMMQELLTGRTRLIKP
ncbi:restriction endonuclease subunit S [Arthrospira platensis]|uniref:Type I RM system S subunit n=1 Tax=Limnospira platensis TaxID=118562 RepID=Q307A0_LIMPL|nr:restriction endonuclease subunit S [Arthrospira platensis]MBD2670064.1 restriction endonuclease subunit S [Arthrospira platensis FACHB-439]MBD2710583.1 restriction endonuclease subunit S [Arthrospira platensis FACHB-835]QQW30145.1 restriction endonuclease subunit S [Arthrospira sp. PCC 9108]ABB51239.1 type I RM system S subunit [Arthrospira platensis]MBD2573943.1 restriction endonuclease subunit S [Arthrospira platensis FACHB-971]